MLYIPKKYTNMLWITSASIFVVLMLLIVLTHPETFGTEYMVPTETVMNNAFAFSIAVLLFPGSVAYFINLRYRRAVLKNIPYFLRGIMDDVNAGIVFPKALESASERDYGPISDELRIAISKFIMGKTLEEAMLELGERLYHPQGKQMASIIIEAYKSGGRIREVLNTAVDMYSAFSEYREMRKVNVRPYAILIDVAVLIFLAISYVLLNQFLGPITKMSGTPILKDVLSMEYYGTILFWASMVECLFGGIIGGKISEGTVTAGLLHTFVLVIMTIAFFNLMIFPQPNTGKPIIVL